jgi:hypothetical protein
MTDPKHLLNLLKGGVGMFFDVGAELFRVELTPFTPTLFRSERAGFGGGQIPVNGAPPQIKPPGRLDLGATRVEEFDHSFPQVQRISLHARKPIRLCAIVYMNCYNWGLGGGRVTIFSKLRFYCAQSLSAP